MRVPHRCAVCDGPLIMGGPIWNREIHNATFVKRLLDSARANQAGENGHKLMTTERIQAILSAIIDEDILGKQPLSYELSHIAGTFKVQNPRKGQLLAAFQSLGYMLTQTYYEPKLFKTNAPPEVIYDIFRAWKAQVYDNDKEKIMKNISETSVAYRILQREVQVKPSFDEEQVKQLLKL